MPEPLQRSFERPAKTLPEEITMPIAFDNNVLVAWQTRLRRAYTEMPRLIIVDNYPPYGRNNCQAKTANAMFAVTNADNYRCFMKQINSIPWVSNN